MTTDGNARNDVLLSIRDLKMYFPVTKGVLFQKHVGDIKAVDGLSFDIHRGETLGLVGESGCGKSTAGRAILHLYQPTEGSIEFEGQQLNTPIGKMRSRMQMIFQDPYASLNPRMSVRSIIGEPLEVHYNLKGRARDDRVKELLSIVGLNPKFISRYPHEFSGGRRQRIGIARALAVKPDFIICDEPISALDVSIQAQVINLLQDLQEKFNLTYLFIAHDLALVRHISNRVAVMYLGKIVELTDRVSLYRAPMHPYTRALLSAVPIPDPVIEMENEKNRVILQGDVPSPAHPPEGCNFCTRCPAKERVMKEKGIDCDRIEPEFHEMQKGHWVACHLN